ncbi:MAG: hypothetical protein BVN28_05255 [Nitrospira sp. ST-bin4]|nr:MAG: hypothetical protein BVN28_05255 [Nitrospira sp. ST-bin4]
MITAYLAKYFAYEFPKRCPSDSLKKLVEAVAGDQIDLNSHQVNASLFALAGRAVEESRPLVSLHDTLLPKLISGELRMKNAGRFVEVAT